MNVPIRLTGTAMVGIGSRAGSEEQKNDQHDQHECLEERFLHLVHRVRDEGGRVVRHLPRKIVRKALRCLRDTLFTAASVFSAFAPGAW